MFVTNSSALQHRINKAEGIAIPEPMNGPLEETYAKSVLKSAQQVRSGEQKILGVFWIQSDKEWKQFIQNRMNEIRGLTPAKC